MKMHLKMLFETFHPHYLNVLKTPRCYVDIIFDTAVCGHRPGSRLKDFILYNTFIRSINPILILSDSSDQTAKKQMIVTLQYPVHDLSSSCIWHSLFPNIKYLSISVSHHVVSSSARSMSTVIVYECISTDPALFKVTNEISRRWEDTVV